MQRDSLIQRSSDALEEENAVDINRIAMLLLAGFPENVLRARVGGKSIGLAKLAIIGVAIPKTIVVPVGKTFDVEGCPNWIRNCDSFAIRSSAVSEDGNFKSYAGVFDSLLNVRKNDIAQSILRVKESAKSEKAIAYAQVTKSEVQSMAVIIQPMIKAKLSGVWVGFDDNSGRVEWVEGLGDVLVQGLQTPRGVTIDNFEEQNIDELPQEIAKSVRLF